MIEQRIQELEAYIKSLEKANARIIARHGTGARPSWVSGDLGYNEARMQSARLEIEELKEDLV